MKRFLRVLLAGLLFPFAGCHYEFPVTKGPGPAIEAGLVGRWIQSGDMKPDEFRQILVVLPLQEGGAVVDLKVEADEHWFFRVVSLGGELASLHQLEFLGSSTGERPESDRYAVAWTRVADGQLEWRLIDPGKVGEVKDGPALLNRLKSAGPEMLDLFGETSVFRFDPPEESD